MEESKVQDKIKKLAKNRILQWLNNVEIMVEEDGKTEWISVPVAIRKNKNWGKVMECVQAMSKYDARYAHTNNCYTGSTCTSILYEEKNHREQCL